MCAISSERSTANDAHKMFHLFAMHLSISFIFYFSFCLYLLRLCLLCVAARICSGVYCVCVLSLARTRAHYAICVWSPPTVTLSSPWVHGSLGCIIKPRAFTQCHINDQSMPSTQRGGYGLTVPRADNGVILAISFERRLQSKPNTDRCLTIIIFSFSFSILAF